MQARERRLEMRRASSCAAFLRHLPTQRIDRGLHRARGVGGAGRRRRLEQRPDRAACLIGGCQPHGRDIRSGLRCGPCHRIAQVDHRGAGFEHREKPFERFADRRAVVLRNRPQLIHEIAGAALEARAQRRKRAGTGKRDLLAQVRDQMPAQRAHRRRQEQFERDRRHQHRQHQRDRVVDERGRVVCDDVVGAGQEAEIDAVADAVAGQRRARRQPAAERERRREHDAEQREAVDCRIHEEHHDEPDRGRAGRADRHLERRPGRPRGRRDERADGAAIQHEQRAGRPRGRDPEQAEHERQQHRARARDGRDERIGARFEAGRPLFARVRGRRERQAGPRVGDVAVDEPVEQFDRRVEVLQRRGAGRIHAGSHRVRAAGQRRPEGLERCDECFGERVRVARRALPCAIDSRGQFRQAAVDGRRGRAGLSGVQPRDQLAQRVQARRRRHPFRIEPGQAAVAQAGIRRFEHGGAAGGLRMNGFVDHAQVQRFEKGPVGAPAEHRAHIVGELHEAAPVRAMELRAQVLREDQRADGARAQDADRDFGHARHGRQERGVRVLPRRNADQRGRVAGKHEPVGAEVAVARGAGRAYADPQRRRAEEEFGRLAEQADQHQHRQQADHGAADPVQAFREHHPALRLHQHEHGRHRRARHRQLELHRDAERQQRGEQRLEHVEPRDAARACPVAGGLGEDRKRLVIRNVRG